MCAGAQRTILLTGASGVVGVALLPELAAHHEVVCLVHETPVAGFESVSGDVTQPRLGLTESGYTQLAERIDCVIHSAALTDWAAPAERLEAVNVGAPSA